MPIVPVAPTSAVFGYEVADDQSAIKSILKQLTEALVSNSVAVTLPGSFLAPNLSVPSGTGANSANFSGSPYDVLMVWMKNIEAAMDGASIARTNPTFNVGEDDNQSVRLFKRANAAKLALQAASYLK